jgi:hypothetical protein
MAAKSKSTKRVVSDDKPEPMKLRTLRSGSEWDDAMRIAAERGDSVPDMLRATLKRYVKRHAS